MDVSRKETYMQHEQLADVVMTISFVENDSGRGHGNLPYVVSKVYRYDVTDIDCFVRDVMKSKAIAHSESLSATS
jgi:hypothetical protein